MPRQTSLLIFSKQTAKSALTDYMKTKRVLFFSLDHASHGGVWFLCTLFKGICVWTRNERYERWTMLNETLYNENQPRNVPFNNDQHLYVVPHCGFSMLTCMPPFLVLEQGNYNPDWLTKGNFTSDEMRSILVNHTTTVSSYYGTRVYGWDVVSRICTVWLHYLVVNCVRVFMTSGVSASVLSNGMCYGIATDVSLVRIRIACFVIIQSPSAKLSQGAALSVYERITHWNRINISNDEREINWKINIFQIHLLPLLTTAGKWSRLWQPRNRKGHLQTYRMVSQSAGVCRLGIQCHVCSRWQGIHCKYMTDAALSRYFVCSICMGSCNTILCFFVSGWGETVLQRLQHCLDGCGGRGVASSDGTAPVDGVTKEVRRRVSALSTTVADKTCCSNQKNQSFSERRNLMLSSVLSGETSYLAV